MAADRPLLTGGRYSEVVVRTGLTVLKSNITRLGYIRLYSKNICLYLKLTFLPKQGFLLVF
jgi:hypothetical protein